MINTKGKNLFSLEGKKGLIFGIANKSSVAYGCAKAMHAMGAEIAATYLNDKTKEYAGPLVEELGISIFEPCDLLIDGQLEAVFKKIEKEWGKLDFLVHSLAFATKEDLQGRVVDCSRDGFGRAMDISCHSFMAMAKLAEPLMKDGGSLMTLTFSGSNRVLEEYGIMGPIKASLESVTRYMAYELGPKGINVNAISPGPLPTRAASGIRNFDDIMEAAKKKAPMHRLVTIDEIGAMSAYLASDAGKIITGEILVIDGGYSIMA